MLGSPSLCGVCYTFGEARLTYKGYYCNTCIYDSVTKELYETYSGTPYHTFSESDWKSRLHTTRPLRKSKAKQNLRTLIRKCNDGASAHRDKEPTKEVTKERQEPENLAGVLSIDSKMGETSLRCNHCSYETRRLKKRKDKQMRDHLK